jgi:hypothetical protein
MIRVLAQFRRFNDQYFDRGCSNDSSTTTKAASMQTTACTSIWCSLPIKTLYSSVTDICNVFPIPARCLLVDDQLNVDDNALIPDDDEVETVGRTCQAPNVGHILLNKIDNWDFSLGSNSALLVWRTDKSLDGRQVYMIKGKRSFRFTGIQIGNKWNNKQHPAKKRR